MRQIVDDRELGRAELVRRIRAEIERDGPMTFDRFMTFALYEPELGYYAAQASAPNRSLDDFQTSPQVHASFGHLIAREVRKVWDALGRPRPLVIAEPGAGDGTLACQILDGLAQIESDLPVEYHAADVRLGADDRPEQPQRPESGAPITERLIWRWPSLASLAQSNVKAHCVVTNEFFDALPVHRVCWLDGGLRELYVDWTDRGFVERVGQASAAARDAWAASGRSNPPEGWRGEVCAAMDSVLAPISRIVEWGVVLTIDYGYGDELSVESTPPDSLVAYHRHQWTDDLYHRVGEQDLTSHVDFRAFLRVGCHYGLEPAGSMSQREFLLDRGLSREADTWASRETTVGKRWQARFAMTELVKSDGLGKLRIVAQQRGVEAYRLRLS